MRVYLDDVRSAPEGWIRVRRPQNAIRLLETGLVTHISVDHDLGNDRESGYTVLCWIEEKVMTAEFKPPQITVHTANPAAAPKMHACVRAILRFSDETKGRV